ncbi:stage II sporulation protein R [Sporosarcina sp. Te-1]|uniref:stage II sporulation protein R n=1 Tax=Sporosarcina sp. Te-1 TaxID=2818390 RepID=UPI001A9D3B8B|nr:stage II sporulation protein R [Sporosarcina sp. Te-1]QTD40750.1 stage II sporulation protein R [Sporosarcina sp. Te-1]
MLQDYNIMNSKNENKKWVSVLEFILLLFLIQSAILLFNGSDIPEDALRVRILAHSNAPADQQVKETIRQEIEPLIREAFTGASSQADFIRRMDGLEEEITRIAEGKADGRTVEFEKKAALFPPKRSGFYVTPQAPYEAYILTIGSGRGDNWWCALFQNVCFPDEKVKEEQQEEEKVTFFLWEWIKGLFS